MHTGYAQRHWDTIADQVQRWTVTRPAALFQISRDPAVSKYSRLSPMSQCLLTCIPDCQGSLRYLFNWTMQQPQSKHSRGEFDTGTTGPAQ